MKVLSTNSVVNFFANIRLARTDLFAPVGELQIA
jgi:hypothetical protein